MMVAEALARDIGSLGGSMDAQTPGLIAFTIPVDVGFPAIERAFAAAAERHPGAECMWRDDERQGNLVFDEPVVVH
jgi:hypothetical protein